MSGHPYAYIGGPTVGGLTSALSDDGFMCTSPARPTTPQLRTWRCDGTVAEQHEIVLISAGDEGHVHVLDTTIVRPSGAPDPAATQQLFRTVAGLVHQADSTQAAPEQAWAAQHAGRDATARVGKLALRSQATNTANQLELDAGVR